MSSDSITPEMVQAVARVIAGSRYWNCPDKTEVGVLARQALEAALEFVPAKSGRLFFVDEESESTAKDRAVQQMQVAMMLAVKKRASMGVLLADAIRSCPEPERLFAEPADDPSSIDDPMFVHIKVEPEA